jgi:hypothetical protein
MSWPRPALALRSFVICCICFVVWGYSGANGQLLGDKGGVLPLLQIDTAHFRVIAPPRLKTYAVEVAKCAEYMREAVVSVVGNDPGITWIVVGDETDVFNGFAVAGPYPFIRVFATFPRPTDLGAAWHDLLVMLLSHEFTHVAHLSLQRDSSGGTGSRGAIQSILGKVPGLTTARVPPPWFVEGYAIWLEERLAKRGRVSDSSVQTLRAQMALGNTWPSLGEIGLGPLERWPGGNTRYQFGAGFVEFLIDSVTEAGIHQALLAYNSGNVINPIDWASAWRTATGQDLELMWAQFREREIQRATASDQALKSSGLPYGERRFAGSIPAFRPDGGVLAFWDGQLRQRDTTGQISSPSMALATRPHRLSWQQAPTTGGETWRLVYSRFIEQGSSTIGEVFVINNGQEQRITSGAHARDAVAFGDCVLFVRELPEESSLYTLCPGANGEWQQQPVLVAPNGWHLSQPAASIQGDIAVTVWRPGGFVDIAVVDTTTKQLVFQTSDPAQDIWPSFDGENRLYWTSDRAMAAETPRFQLYRQGLGANIEQLTAFPGGVYTYSLAADQVVASGYGANGLDLRQGTLTSGLFSTKELIEPVALEIPDVEYSISDYSINAPALYWLPVTAAGLGISVTGADPAGIQQWNVEIGHDLTPNPGTLLASTPTLRASYQLSPNLDISFHGGISASARDIAVVAGPSWSGRADGLAWQTGLRFGLNLRQNAGSQAVGGAITANAMASTLKTDVFGYPNGGWKLAGQLSSTGQASVSGQWANMWSGIAVEAQARLEHRDQSISMVASGSGRWSLRTNYRLGDGVYALERISIQPGLGLIWKNDPTVPFDVYVSGQVLGDVVVSYYAPVSVGLELRYSLVQQRFGVQLRTTLPLLDGLSAR